MKAFPWQEWINTTDPYTMNPVSHGGMDLRDYFAAKAMQVLMQDYLRDMEWEVDNPYEHFNCAIEVSYRVADAMMKAREQ